MIQIRMASIDITAPRVPSSGADLMPVETETFGEGLLEILSKVTAYLLPDIAEAMRVCCMVLAMVLLLSLVRSMSGSTEKILSLAGTVCISGILLGSTTSMLHLAAETVTELSEYGKLLIPVMTSALAAQGGITTSAALYAGSTVFNALMSTVISRLLVPILYLYLALSIGSRALTEKTLTQMQGFLKWLVTWSLKTLLYVFTGYMSITGVVSGSADAIKIKATKLTISGMVPVVGGILSDASEALLVSAGVVKSAAGIYGILAVISICLVPFLRIGIHYLFLKATAGLCGILDNGNCTDVVGDFACAMGIMVAMTGAVCLLLLISTVCFLREVG